MIGDITGTTSDAWRDSVGEDVTLNVGLFSSEREWCGGMLL